MKTVKILDGKLECFPNEDFQSCNIVKSYIFVTKIRICFEKCVQQFRLNKLEFIISKTLDLLLQFIFKSPCLGIAMLGKATLAPSCENVF